ncbi:hypothetical protein [Nocardia thailandica]|uniref:hypothetical protein n=1 Tax=Nocardia thailandica TaxID=257275 RepID=UPI00030E0358|nr:hypothetical protein [Nocardia thailandica]
MPKDNRIFITLAVDMDRHPKFASLNDAQKWLIVKAIMHCREYLTDGRVALPAWRKMGTDRNRKAVLATGVCSEDAEQNCVIFHDYAQHNQTRAEVDAAKEKARSAGQKGGLRKAANAKRNTPKRPSSGLAAASDPLSENVAEIEIEEENSTYVPSAAYVSNADAHDEPPRREPTTEATGPAVPPDGWKLVRHATQGLSQPTRTALAIQASALLHAGVDPDDIATGLETWMARPDARLGLFRHLVDDAVKARRAPAATANSGTPLAYNDRKVLGWEEAAEAAKRSLGLIPGTNQTALPTGRGGDRPLLTILDADYVEEIA